MLIFFLGRGAAVFACISDTTTGTTQQDAVWFTLVRCCACEGWWVLLHAVLTQHAFFESVELSAGKASYCTFLMVPPTAVQLAIADDPDGSENVAGCTAEHPR